MSSSKEPSGNTVASSKSLGTTHKPMEIRDSKRPVKIRICDAPEHVQTEAVRLANEIMDTRANEMAIAEHIKNNFDEKFQPGPWHCVAGRKFGSYVTHECGTFVYFNIGSISILVYKTKDLIN